MFLSFIINYAVLLVLMSSLRIVKTPHFAKLFQRRHNNNITYPCTFIGLYGNPNISYLIEYKRKNNTRVFTHKLDMNCLVLNNNKDSRIIMSNLHILCSCNGVLLVKYVIRVMIVLLVVFASLCFS